MRREELGADGRGDDGVRREDAVQPAEDDRLHTVAAALVTLRRDLDSKGGGWGRRRGTRLARATKAVAGRPVDRPLPGRTELPRAARRP